MNLQQKNSVKNHFSRAATSYDAYAIIQREMAKELAIFLQQAENKFNQIIEIGCGTGLFTSELVKHFPQSGILATDISASMLEQAQEKLGSFPQISYLQLDGEKPLPASFLSVDLIASSAVFQWFSDPKKAFKNFAASLKPGGHLAFATFGPNTFFELAKAFQAAYAQAKKEPSYVHGPQFLAKSELKNMLENFSCDIFSQTKEQYFPSVKAFLHSIKKVGAQNAAAEKNILKSRIILQNMLENYDRNYRTEKGVRATYEIIYCLARKKGI